MNRFEIRRDNLHRILLSRFDNRQVDLANAVGKSPAYISFIFTRRKRLGEELAREFEKRLGLQKHALDTLGMNVAHVLEEPKPSDYIAKMSPQADSLVRDLMTVDRAGKLSPDLADSISALLRSTHPTLFKKQPGHKKLLKALKDGSLD